MSIDSVTSREARRSLKAAEEKNTCVLDIYSYFEKGCRKNVPTTIPKSNMGYDQYAVPDTVAVESSMSLSLTLSNTCPWPLVAFFQISLKNSELKTTHNTFRDYGMHFSDNLSRNSCIPNLRSIQSSCSANFFDRHSCTP